ncbi:hypothetical protein ACFWYW_58030 [Nonomuraea sp. NPDC059023]|uniref:hypothetical protein n=1 Tax=unclassified Nonomuraea TaxID=2593643 RepID=UPI0036C346D3
MIKVIASSIGLCARYSPVRQGEASWPAGGVSARMVQGAATSTREEQPQPAA